MARGGRVPTLIAALLAMAAAVPAWAQDRLTESALAGVTLPEASRSWNDDPEGAKAATLELAASLTSRTCGDREFHNWLSVSETPEEIRDKIEAAFVTAGWSLEVISRGEGGERINLAARAGDELVMSWLPEGQSIGLLMCQVAGRATLADADLAGLEEAPPPDAADAGADPADAALAEDAVPGIRPSLDAAAEPDAVAPPGEAGEDPAAGGEPGAALEPEPDAGPPDEAPPAAVAEPVPQAPPRAVEPAARELAAAPSLEPAANPPAATAAEDIELPGTGALLALATLLVAAVVLAAAAVFLLRRGLASLRPTGPATAGWPTAIATVLSSRVIVDKRSEAGREIVRFLPHVEYEFEAGGGMYRATRYRFGEEGETDRAVAERLIARLPAGAGIEISFDPHDPATAVIETERRRPSPALALGAGAAVLSVVCLVGAVIL